MSATDTLAPCPWRLRVREGLRTVSDIIDATGGCVAYGVRNETAVTIIDAMNRRAPASQEAMVTAKALVAGCKFEYTGFSEGVIRERAIEKIAAALIAAHAKAEAEGYARGYLAGLKSAATLARSRKRFDLAESIVALSPPTASAKAGSDE